MNARNIVLILLLTFIGGGVFAQLEVPRPSPLGKVKQDVGLNKVTIEYSRPGVKDRLIFGGLVPFGELWRTGANAATKITLEDDAVIGGKEVPAGEYSLLTIPGLSEWTIIINKDATASTGSYKEEMDQARFTVRPRIMTDKVESFTILISNVTMNSADIELLWENTKVSFPIETEVDSKVMAQIEEVMKGVHWRTYYDAAMYYLDTDKDLAQALEWVNKALEQNETFWMVHGKAKIFAAQGEYDKAIETANRSIELAKAIGYDSYVKLNEDAIAEWEAKK